MLKKLNPLELTITVPTQHPRKSELPGGKIPSQATYKRVLLYVGKLIEAEWNTKSNPILTKYKRVSDLILAVKSQFRNYSLLQYPFDRPLMPGQTVRSWWSSFLEQDDACVLAVRNLNSGSSMILKDLWHVLVYRQEAVLNQTKLYARRACCLGVHENEHRRSKCTASTNTCRYDTNPPV